MARPAKPVIKHSERPPQVPTSQIAATVEEEASPNDADQFVSQDGDVSPIMADIMCGPNAPLAKSFIMAGWRAIAVDLLIDPSHDLSDTCCQTTVHSRLAYVDFIWAALDCSTKCRCRERPRKFANGRPKFLNNQ